MSPGCAQNVPHPAPFMIIDRSAAGVIWTPVNIKRFCTAAATYAVHATRGQGRLATLRALIDFAS